MLKSSIKLKLIGSRFSEYTEQQIEKTLKKSLSDEGVLLTSMEDLSSIDFKADKVITNLAIKVIHCLTEEELRLSIRGVENVLEYLYAASLDNYEVSYYSS